MRGFLTVGLLAAALSLGAGMPVKWANLDDAHYRAGRRTSEGYLRGKVVAVDRWGVKCPPCRALLPRLEVLWQSFNERPFVLIGGHCKGWGTPEAVKRLAEKNGLTYPIYEEGALARGEPRFDTIPFIYVVDPAGEVIYAGDDSREATDVIVSAIVDLESPSTVERWKYHLDYEIDLLPGRALRRLRAFRKAHPAEAKAYDAAYARLEKIPSIERLVKLLEIVDKARAYRPRDAAARQRYVARIDEMAEKFGTLKDHADPLVVQEAKNALADLQWTKNER